MANIPFLENEISIEAIWNWYEDQKEALHDFKFKIIRVISGKPSFYEGKFFHFTLDELNEYFGHSQVELDHLTCFALIAATEARLRKDFQIKVKNKDKSDLGRKFRQLYKNKKNKISLEEDIIEAWKNILTPDKKKEMSNFLGLMNYRHWLAHGRYWEPKFGQNYSIDATYDIADNIICMIQSAQ